MRYFVQMQEAGYSKQRPMCYNDATNV